MPPKNKTKKTKDIESESEDINSEYDGHDSETDNDELNDDSVIESDNDNSNDEYEETTEKQPDNKCFYKFAVTKVKDDSDSEDFDEYFDDDDKMYDSFLDKENRISLPILTKYERVRVLADRVKYLTLGAKPMLKNTVGMTDEEIAKEELEQKVLPFIIERVLPNGKKERWELNELDIIN